MAAYPESAPTPTYPLILSPRTQTMITTLGGGAEHRVARILYPPIDVTVAYSYMTATHMETLWEFYEARRGAYEAFHIYELRLLASVYPSWTGRYIATADGTNLTYDIPGRSTSAQTIYADSVALTVTTDYSISYSGGTSSSDRVTLTGAAASWTGKVLTCSFTGILRIPVRFAEDSLSFEMFEMSYFRNGGIKLHGLKWG